MNNVCMMCNEEITMKNRANSELNICKLCLENSRNNE